MKHPYELQEELDDTHLVFVKLMQNGLDWCVETERYEMAARLRDLIKYETTDDEGYKHQYYLDLLKKYAPETPEFYKRMKEKYNL